MKVILLQNVARIGQKFEVKDVPSGHALNFLIPRKLAELATPQSLRRLEERRGRIEAEQGEHAEAFAAILAKLADTKVEMVVPANEKGHLFKGVHQSDIAEHLGSVGLAVEETSILLPAPIKEVGEHIVKLEAGDQKGEFTLTISAKS